MADWTKSFPIIFEAAPTGDDTSVAIGKIIQEFTKVYEYLNRLRTHDAGVADPIDPIDYHLKLDLSGATPTLKYHDGSSFVALTVPPSSVPTYLAGLRNVVLSGAALSSTGEPSWVQAGSGLTASIYATAVPVLLSIADGSDAFGTVDHLLRLSADAASAWTALPALSTSYLYVDRDTGTGAITYGHTTAEPKYQDDTPDEVTGCIWFSPATGVTQRWSGASWVVVQRIVVAKVVTGAASVSTVENVPFVGFFDHKPLSRNAKFPALTVTDLSASSLLTGVRPYIKVTHQGASGASSGGVTETRTWTTRTLTTEVVDADGLCSLASNQIELAAGTYRVRAWSVYRDCGTVGTRLRNVTDGTTLLVSNNGYTEDYLSVPMFLDGYITVEAGKKLELQFYTTDTESTGGLGSSLSSGEVEVWAQLEFWKEA